MAVTTQTIKIDLNTGKVLPVAYTHQNDTNRQFVFEVYNNGVAYTLGSTTAKFAYVSPKVNGQYTVIAGSSMASGTVSGNTVTVTLPSAYTAVSGTGLLTMILTSSSNTIRPINIRLVVQKSADGSDVVSGASDFDSVIESYIENDMADFIDAWFSNNPSAITDGLADAVSAWMDENLSETSPVVDSSLTVSGAAADAKKTGDEISDLKSDLNEKVDTDLMQKCTLIEVPKSANLWDTTNKQAGWYHSNGNIYDYSEYYYYNIGEVSEGDVINCYYLNSNNVVSGATMYAVVCLDENGARMASVSVASVSSFTVPAGVASLVITIKNPYDTTMILKNNSSAPTAFIAYQDAYSYYVAGEDFIPAGMPSDKVDIDGSGQVTAKNLQIIDYSPNLFDLSTVTYDYLINQVSGAIQSASGHDASDWIPVEAETDYSFYISKTKEIRYAWYDSDKTFISGYLVSSFSTQTLTTPENAAYMRFSTTTIEELYIQIEKGSATPYRDYGEAYIKAEYAPSAESFIMNLPSKIFATTGIELNIYFENLVEDWTKYNWDVTCSVGMQLERGYRVTPDDSDAGTYTLTIRATLSDTVYVEKSTSLIITTASAGSGENVSVLVLGDSTTANGIAVTKLAENFTDDAMSITLCGTLGTSPYLHEGRSGWTFYAYLTSSSDNAFYNPDTSTFDADYYFTNSGVTQPDWFFINLGINDTFGALDDRTISSQCSAIKGRCDTVIDSILSASPSTKIGICLTIPPNHSQDAFGKAYSNGQTRNRYKRNNVMWVNSLIEEYDNRESDGIYLIPIYTNLDTVYNMGLETLSVNARNTSVTYQSPIGNGGVHPVESGYWQIADVYTAFLKAQA